MKNTLIYNKPSGITELYDNGEKFVSGKSFSVWLNNEFIPDNPDKAWIKDASSKAVKKAIENACTAFTRFFHHQSAFPNFKKKGRADVKMYFVKNNPKDCACERHRIHIPTLGWVKLKEKGYIPVTKDGWKIRSGTVSIKAGRYYVSVLVEVPDTKAANNSGDGIGIDLGLKDFAVVSNGKTYKNINQSAKIKKLEKRLRRAHRRLSRKYENLKKGKAAQKANIQKQKLKVQKLYQRIDAVRTDYINKTIASAFNVPSSLYAPTPDVYPKCAYPERSCAFTVIPLCVSVPPLVETTSVYVPAFKPGISMRTPPSAFLTRYSKSAPVSEPFIVPL